MATQVKYAQSNAVITTGWTNPTYVYVDDTNFATAAPAKSASVVSDFYNFGFTIPDGAIINSITVETNWYVSTTASIATLSAQAVKNTTLMGTALTNNTEPTVETKQTFTTVGTWTVAELNDNTTTGFKIRLTGTRGNSTTAFTGYVDYLKVTVDYTAVTTGITTLTGSGDIYPIGSVIKVGTVNSIESSTSNITSSLQTNGLVSINESGNVSVSGFNIKTLSSQLTGQDNNNISGTVIKNSQTILTGSENQSVQSSIIKNISANINESENSSISYIVQVNSGNINTLESDNLNIYSSVITPLVTGSTLMQGRDGESLINGSVINNAYVQLSEHDNIDIRYNLIINGNSNSNNISNEQINSSIIVNGFVSDSNTDNIDISSYNIIHGNILNSNSEISSAYGSIIGKINEIVGNISQSESFNNNINGSIIRTLSTNEVCNEDVSVNSIRVINTNVVSLNTEYSNINSICIVNGNSSWNESGDENVKSSLITSATINQNEYEITNITSNSSTIITGSVPSNESCIVNISIIEEFIFDKVILESSNIITQLSCDEDIKVCIEDGGKLYILIDCGEKETVILKDERRVITTLS